MIVVYSREGREVGFWYRIGKRGSLITVQTLGDVKKPRTI